MSVRESGQTFALSPHGELAFACVDPAEDERVIFRFTRNGDGRIGAVSVQFDSTGMRIDFEKERSAAPDAAALREYEGSYASSELGSIHRIEVTDGRMWWRRPRHAAVALDAAIPDVFTCTLGTLRFERDEHARLTGFAFASSRARGLRFERLDEADRGAIRAMPAAADRAWLAACAGMRGGATLWPQTDLAAPEE